MRGSRKNMEVSIQQEEKINKIAYDIHFVNLAYPEPNFSLRVIDFKNTRKLEVRISSRRLLLFD